jgi:hypothetical protein
MFTAEPIQKTRKAKTNKFVLILEQFLGRYNLSAKSSPKQLSEHASELSALLPDWKARKCVKEALTRGTEKRSVFSKEQIEALVPDQRNILSGKGLKKSLKVKISGIFSLILYLWDQKEVRME